MVEGASQNSDGGGQQRRYSSSRHSQTSDGRGFDSDVTTNSEAENEGVLSRATISPARLQESYAHMLQKKGA